MIGVSCTAAHAPSGACVMRRHGPCTYYVAMKYGEHARDTVRRCACRCDCDTEHVYNGTFVGDTPGGTVLHELRALTCTVCGGTAYVVDVPRPDLPDEDFGRVLDVRGDA